MNHKVRNIVVLIGILVILGGIYTCTEKEKPSPGTLEPGKMGKKAKATSDYEKYFGKVPDVGMVSCEGLVIYFPAREGGSLVPYPFFVTTPGKRDELVARTMLSGLPSPDMGKQVSPIFPPGLSLKGIEIDGDTFIISVAGVLYDQGELDKAAGALLKTYFQFYPDIKGASVIVSGSGDRGESSELKMNILEPGPPKVLDAFVVREEGETQPREVRVIFDRPVMIKDLQIDGGGDRIKGKVYLAEFSMAAILEKEKPLGLKRGEKISVKYSIHDFMGREGSGERTFDVRVEEHPH